MQEFQQKQHLLSARVCHITFARLAASECVRCRFICARRLHPSLALPCNFAFVLQLRGALNFAKAIRRVAPQFLLCAEFADAAVAIKLQFEFKDGYSNSMFTFCPRKLWLACVQHSVCMCVAPKLELIYILSGGRGGK